MPHIECGIFFRALSYGMDKTITMEERMEKKKKKRFTQTLPNVPMVISISESSALCVPVKAPSSSVLCRSSFCRM